jgi:hypothetical protein
LDVPAGDLWKLLDGIGKLTKQDYAVKLGSLLGEELRKYYKEENFKILKGKIREKVRDS